MASGELVIKCCGLLVGLVDGAAELRCLGGREEPLSLGKCSLVTSLAALLCQLGSLALQKLFLEKLC